MQIASPTLRLIGGSDVSGCYEEMKGKMKMEKEKRQVELSNNIDE